MEKRLFMTHKSTDELKNELKTAANLRDYLSKNKENLLTTGLPEYLERLLSQKGLKKGLTCTKFSAVKKSPQEISFSLSLSGLVFPIRKHRKC